MTDVLRGTSFELGVEAGPQRWSASLPQTSVSLAVPRSALLVEYSHHQVAGTPVVWPCALSVALTLVTLVAWSVPPEHAARNKLNASAMVSHRRIGVHSCTRAPTRPTEVARS